MNADDAIEYVGSIGQHDIGGIYTAEDYDAHKDLAAEVRRLRETEPGYLIKLLNSAEKECDELRERLAAAEKCIDDMREGGVTRAAGNVFRKYLAEWRK